MRKGICSSTLVVYTSSLQLISIDNVFYKNFAHILQYFCGATIKADCLLWFGHQLLLIVGTVSIKCLISKIYRLQDSPLAPPPRSTPNLICAADWGKKKCGKGKTGWCYIFKYQFSPGPGQCVNLI
jgi:hypothetical protein